MSKENGHIISEELLFRHFDGTARENEDAQIEKWKTASDENRLEYERIHIFYLDSKALANLNAPPNKYDNIAAWNKFEQKNQLTKPNISFRLTQFMRIAAMLIIVLGASWFIYDSYYSSNIETVASTQKTIEQTLPDGSLITLNKNSIIIYPDKFEGNERKVELKGEAHFNITPNPNKPFIIKASEIEIIVLGTSFNINANDNVDSIVVSVDTGIVRIISAIRKETLEAGTIGVYYKKTQVLTKIESDNMDVQNFWRTQNLSFNATPLSEAIETINSTYLTEISLSDPLIGNCKITVSFENEPVEDILEIIATTLRLELSKTNNGYVLTGKGCTD